MEWRDNIQSTDPTLRDKMFKDRVVQPKNESGNGEKANDNNENLGTKRERIMMAVKRTLPKATATTI